eukprot:COSAG04_NODE_622_length_11834_cov_56.658969_4_plen_53_part_00
MVPWKSDDDDATALMDVASTGDMEKMQALLKAGASVDVQDKNGINALMQGPG